MLTDQELADQCLAGNEQAWKELVQRFNRRIWSVAFQFTGRADEAEELTQDIFVHLIAALRSFDQSGKLGAWIQRVARNYAIDHYRRMRRERAALIDGEKAQEMIGSVRDPSRSMDPHRHLEKKDLASWLRQTIDKLPEELAEAVVLRDLQEMTYEEISARLRIPLGTVKSRINRGRLELARQLRFRRRELGSAAAGGNPS